MRSIRIAILAGASCLALASPAQAQDSAGTSDEPVNKDEIVVTGTLIRGIAPAGTNVVSLNQQQVQSSGATTVTNLLSKVPQFSSFNDLQSVNSAGSSISTNRPNLRNLSNQTVTGTTATLLLLNGHRVVGMGLNSTVPDADFVPPGIIERVEIVPDGGSALYGSDAVTGVVNFITMKKFDGLKVDARYGFGEQFHTFDANAAVGKDWGSGSVWVSYNYTENSKILGRDRDFVFTPQSKVTGTNTIIQSLNCAKPNILAAAVPFGQVTVYGAQSPSAAGVPNICDISDSLSMYPAQKRHSVYAGLNQQLTDWLEMNLDAFYYRKDLNYQVGEYGTQGSVNLGPAFLAPFGFVSSPFDTVNLTGSPAETKNINFTLGPDYPEIKTVTLDVWGVGADFTAKLGGDWQLRTRAAYGRSKAVLDSPQINTTLIPSLVISGAFNPFAPATSSPAALAQLLNYEDYGKATQYQTNLRAIADGSLFELPGGKVKAAIGVEYRAEGYNSSKGLTVATLHDHLPKYQLSRRVESVYGEIVAPIFGGNGPSLTLSASGRYDHYSDVGGTFNPKFGATFKPVDWISVRGAWGKSFVAPSLADNALADPTDARWVSGATVTAFLAPAAVLAANGFPAIKSGQDNIIIVLGSNPGLKPQTATTWSIGADIAPPSIPGLHLSATYYNITYKNIISLVPFTNQPVYFSTYAPQSFILNPTLAQIKAIVGQDPDGSINGTPCAPLPQANDPAGTQSCVYAIQDVRKQNLSGFKQSGIDFSADYATATGFGGIDFNVGGTYVLTRASAPTAVSPFTSELGTFNSRLKVRSTLGADIAQFRGQVTWNLSQGFNVPAIGLPQQTHVGDYNTFDLFFKYDFKADGAFNNLQLNLTITNVFNQPPPVYYGGSLSATAGFLNGSTFGRLVQVGFRRKF